MIVTDRFRDGDPSNDLDSIPGRADRWQGGDLRGVIDDLDRISSLGVTAIWITPVALQVRGGYHGYWTLDPYQIDPHLGDLATLKELVTTAHHKGLRVILDVVLNHVGYGHPWLSEHPERFHPQCQILFSDQKSVEDCWLAGLPDLNTEDPAVRTYLMDSSAWLLRESGADGLRVDAARHLPKDLITEWSAAMRRVRPDVWLLGEVASNDRGYAAQYIRAGLDAVTDVREEEEIRAGLSFRGDLRRLLEDRGQATLPDAARATFFENHDLTRFVGAGPTDPLQRRRLIQAIAFLLTTPGVPVLYYGTEVALPGGADPDNRRPMPQLVPSWTRVPDGSDVLVATRALARARRDHPVLAEGTLVVLRETPTELVYARLDEDEVAIVALNGDNVADATISFEMPGAGPARPLLAGSSGEMRGRQMTVTLPPRGAQVWLASGR